MSSYELLRVTSSYPRPPSQWTGTGMGLGLDICALAARPSHASLRLLRRSAANHTARQIDADTEHKAPSRESARAARASVYMPLAKNFFHQKQIDRAL